MPRQRYAHPMLEALLGLVVGLLVGFFGAIPPGPINVSVIRDASIGLRNKAFMIALGGALVDALICGALGFGIHWIEALVTHPPVRLALALLLLGTGIKLCFFENKGTLDALVASTAGVPPTPTPTTQGALDLISGALQGAANPALIMNWTVLTTFLVSHRILSARASSAAAFALGVGLGGFLWFALLIELVRRLRDHPVHRRWLARSTRVAGALLILFGLTFTAKSLIEL